MEAAHNVDLNIFAKLSDDRAYRQQFFLAESSALIADQLISLRKRRGLSQTQLAEALGTRQPAISRIEQADYQNWNFNTLRKIAGVLDARVRVLIEPSEDILEDYDNDNQIAERNSAYAEGPSYNVVAVPSNVNWQETISSGQNVRFFNWDLQYLQ